VLEKPVTVLVALYKAGGYLRRKLLNLEQQTRFNDCWIVLLNCQDLEHESAKYKWFLDKYDNVIEIKYETHRRLYPTWNDGIKATQSKYICNSNVDDMWRPEYVETCVDFLETNPEVAVASTYVLVTDKPNQLYPNWIWRDRIPSYPYPVGTAGPCPMWRRSLHDKYGYFGNYRVIGDAKIWEKWYAGGEKFAIIPQNLVLYFRHEHSLECRYEGDLPCRTLDLLEDAKKETQTPPPNAPAQKHAKTKPKTEAGIAKVWRKRSP
jgi:glycosyltransferase involved in cell wall biosynthesis